MPLGAIPLVSLIAFLVTGSFCAGNAMKLPSRNAMEVMPLLRLYVPKESDTLEKTANDLKDILGKPDSVRREGPRSEDNETETFKLDDKTLIVVIYFSGKVDMIAALRKHRREVIFLGKRPDAPTTL